MPESGFERVWRFIARTVAPLAFIILAVCAAPIVAATPVSSNGGAWSVVARCESGGNWNIGTGVAYAPGPRFSPSAAREHAAGPVHRQVAIAERVLRSQGIRDWPRCASTAREADVEVPGTADQAVRRMRP
jgi:hypothetical protein